MPESGKSGANTMFTRASPRIQSWTPLVDEAVHYHGGRGGPRRTPR